MAVKERRKRCGHCRGEGRVYVGAEVSDVLCGDKHGGYETCRSCDGWGWIPRPSNRELLGAIAAWQAAGTVHPMTCGNDSAHADLVGTERDGRVVLVCQGCDYVQRVIPRPIVALTTVKDPAALLRDGGVVGG